MLVPQRSCSYDGRAASNQKKYPHSKLKHAVPTDLYLYIDFRCTHRHVGMYVTDISICTDSPAMIDM